MTRHSKNNSAGAAFTYAERQKLSTAYGTQSSRCTSESLLPFGCCFVCLQTVKEGRCCPRGHLMCKACAVESMVAQKQNFKRKLSEWQKSRDEASRRLQADKERDSEAKKRDFLRQNAEKAMHSDPKSVGKKRSFTEAATSTSVTLSEKDTISVSPQMAPVEEILCMGGGERHSLSLKLLTSVNFTASTDGASFSCPTCLKGLTNGSGAVVSVDCGHAVCRPCHQKLAGNGASNHYLCVVCSVRSARSPIELKSEGTGFAAAGGTVQVSKYDLAFQ
jgi:nitric oxide synthase-interacting protein